MHFELLKYLSLYIQIEHLWMISISCHYYYNTFQIAYLIPSIFIGVKIT